MIQGASIHFPPWYRKIGRSRDIEASILSRASQRCDTNNSRPSFAWFLSPASRICAWLRCGPDASARRYFPLEAGSRSGIQGPDAAHTGRPTGRRWSVAGPPSLPWLADPGVCLGVPCVLGWSVSMESCGSSPSRLFSADSHNHVPRRTPRNYLAVIPSHVLKQIC